MLYEQLPTLTTQPLAAAEMGAFQALYKQTIEKMSLYYQQFAKPKFRIGEKVYVNYCFYKDGVASKINNDFRLRDMPYLKIVSNVFFDMYPIESLKINNKYVVWEHMLAKYIELKEDDTLLLSTIVDMLADSSIVFLEKHSYRVQWAYNLRHHYGSAVPEMALVPNEAIIADAYLNYIQSEVAIEDAKSEMSRMQLAFNRACK